jgi:hypothetical protein
MFWSADGGESRNEQTSAPRDRGHQKVQNSRASGARAFIYLALTVLWSWARERVSERQAKNAVKQMHMKIVEALQRPDISEDRRTHLRHRLEQLDDFEIDSLAMLISPTSSDARK